MTAPALAEILDRLRVDLADEAGLQPSQILAYGRPHEHPRARYFARYSPSGVRLPGVVRVGPDCPRPIRGRCECPPDGSWRPAPGVVRADATIGTALVVPAARLRPALEGTIWVAETYERGPDGLWRCRLPVRTALERIRGASPRRWLAIVRLLAGERPAVAVGPVGRPYRRVVGDAIRALRQLEAWAAEERTGEWERRPRTWWDAPRQARQPSESQSIAEAATSD